MTAKFSTTLSQYDCCRLSPVRREMSRTEAECLNSSISSFSSAAASRLSCANCCPGVAGVGDSSLVCFSAASEACWPRPSTNPPQPKTSSSTSSTRETVLLEVISAPLPPAAKPGAQFPGPKWPPDPASLARPQHGPSRYLPLRPAPGPEPRRAQ